MKGRRAQEFPPRLLSREQVADYLQCSTSTVDNLVSDGLIPGPKDWRGLVRWDKVALDHVIDRVYGLTDGSAEQLSIDEAIDGRSATAKIRRNASQ